MNTNRLSGKKEKEIKSNQNILGLLECNPFKKLKDNNVTKEMFYFISSFVHI